MKKEQLKITFVISSLDFGGAQRVLVNLANYFDKLGYEINIVYSFVNKNKPAYNLNKNINIHHLPTNISFQTGSFMEGEKNAFLIIKSLRQKFRELNPDIIISFMDKTNIYSIVAHLGLRMPLIISERISYDFLQSKIWRIIRRMVYPLSDGMVVLSKYDYDKYYFVKDKKIIFNPLHIDLSLEAKFENKEKIILAVGRLDKQKGYDMLIEAISKVDTKEWKVLILGEGSERSNLEKLIGKLHLEKTIFLLGNKDDVYHYYSRASIFVLSSHYEGFPNVLAEAMGYGCSCISFDCKTGPSDIIQNQVNGLLVPDGETGLLSEGIETLLNNIKLRKKFFIEAVKIREKLKLKKIINEWESYFEQCIEK